MNPMRTFLRSVVSRPALVLFLLTISASSVQAQTPCGPGPNAAPTVCPYTASERLQDYVTRTAGPRALLNSSLGAGIQQARGTPYAWGGGMEGYSRRYASNMGKRVISNTVQLGVEAMLGQDSRYVASESVGVWPRIGYAVKHSFLTRGRNGEREVSFGRIAGALGGGLLSRTWQPDGHDNISNGFRSAGISFSGYVGSNVFREFWPSLRRHLPF